LRGYTELADLNNELSQRNIKMVSKINNLQSQLDMVDKKDLEIASLKENLSKLQTERDTIKQENEKLRMLIKKKLIELKEVQTKHDSEKKEL
jgi:cell division protein FtsB